MQQDETNSKCSCNQKNKLFAGLSMDYNIIPLIITYTSTLILIGGYIYNRFLLYQFGINSNAYYTISDYMLMSLDPILFIGIFVSIIVLWALILSKSHYYKKKKPDVVYIFMLLFLFGLSILMYKKVPNALSSFYYYFLWIILSFEGLCEIIAYISSYIEKNAFFSMKLINIILIALIVYIFYVLIFSLVMANQYKNGKKDLFYGKLAVLSGVPFYPNQKIIFSSSDYYFAWNKEDRILSIIPKSRVTYVEVYP